MKFPNFYPREETIGNPQFFCGRVAVLDNFLKWIRQIPQKSAKSRALMATKKMGKTAILERLFNLCFVHQAQPGSISGGVYPFYIRLPEIKVSLSAFSDTFFYTFLTHYLACKLQKPEWVNKVLSPTAARQAAQDHDLVHVLEEIEYYQELMEGPAIKKWLHASGCPHRLAASTGDFFLQIIDEFQYLNHYIYTDETYQNVMELAGTYHQYAESRIAPVLASGSWVGWLKTLLKTQVNPRFTQIHLGPLTDEEALEAVYTYSDLHQIEISEASALAVQRLSRNHPYYIASIIRSNQPHLDLTNEAGVESALNYETLAHPGEIFGHWGEYIDYAFDQTNGGVAKAIVLFLSMNREVEKTRTEIRDYLQSKGFMLDDEELEKRLRLLEGSDIIREGSTAFRYQGIPDDVFSQVFEVLFAEEIEHLRREVTLANIKKQNRLRMQSTDTEIYQRNKGHFLEFMMIRYLKYQAQKGQSLKELIHNAPKDSIWSHYQSIGEKHFNLIDGYHRQFDIFAQAALPEGLSLLIECKYWQDPVDASVIEQFHTKAEEFRQVHAHLLPIVYSVSGFSNPAIQTMKQYGIAWSGPDLWKVL